MSGHLDEDRDGQLALMDALVFFVAAMTVSTVLLSYATSDDEPLLPSRHSASDPAAILDLFLRTSVGQRVEIKLDCVVFVDDSDDAALCLVLEATALRAGAPVEAFGGLNSVLERLLRAVTSPLFDPHLAVVEVGGRGGASILTLMDAPKKSDLAYASSCELFLEDGADCLVILVLTPASSPEEVDVCVGDLDLLLGVRHAPRDVSE